MQNVQALAEALEVNYLPFPQKAQGVNYGRVVREHHQVFICCSCLLLCCCIKKATFLQLCQKLQCISTGTSQLPGERLPMYMRSIKAPGAALSRASSRTGISSLVDEGLICFSSAVPLAAACISRCFSDEMRLRVSEKSASLMTPSALWR